MKEEEVELKLTSIIKEFSKKTNGYVKKLDNEERGLEWYYFPNVENYKYLLVVRKYYLSMSDSKIVVRTKEGDIKSESEGCIKPNSLYSGKIINN